MVILRPLPDDLAKKASEELNEKCDDNDYYVNTLREWAEKQPFLRARTDDQFLMAFLRGSKFSLEKAKQKLENFYILRAAMPEMFRNRNLSEPKYEAIIKSGAAAALPEPASDGGPLVILLRPSAFNMELHTINDVLKVGSMIVDILMQENDRVFIAGYTFIIDLGNISKAVLMNFEPEFVRRLTLLVNKAAPTRMKGFHFINVLPIFEKLFGMVKSVISAKLKDRFYVHGNNLEELYKYVPKHVLPKEYGGDCDLQTLQAEWWQKLNDYKKFFEEEEEQYGIAEGYERLKQVKDLIADTSVLQGTEGSFRQLEVD
ncbi:PREDICTED: alpha-tocopherol transfer protein-like [Rhagoletis zephyria]|uniref:alpha-tocopherol transfer protein-like n=1 Tax=Rhagoletis zephyria TaxID=28612 RepID=UPI000811862B|nr:PREDICTED: alpha-tocopherol transfer protein-like [Rhagoletis zephyria]